MVTEIVKRAMYALYPKTSLQKYQLQLSYVFHTEWIYHKNTFEGLLAFCKAYTNLTNAKAICTIMTGANVRVMAGMKKENCSNEEFVSRVHQLAQVATIGYHGHFWTSVEKMEQDVYALHSTDFIPESFSEQFDKDLAWFEKNSITHHGIYAGGWWFMNEFIAKKLMENNFKVDMSSSQAPYFYNAFSMNLMIQNKIACGESFYLKDKELNKKLLCIQNLIGAHGSKFPLDFDRNLKKLDLRKHTTGLINSHDYDQIFSTTLNCIKHLLTDASAKFHSYNELIALQEQEVLKEIFI
jgi:hypothetical protein